MKAMCESYEVLGFKHPSDLYEENMYDKYTQAVFGYDVGTVGKDNGYYINVLGKSFAYTRHELDTWNSDRKNVLALINGNIDNEFFRNSHNIPKNPDLAEYMF